MLLSSVMFFMDRDALYHKTCFLREDALIIEITVSFLHYWVVVYCDEVLIILCRLCVEL